MSSQESEMLIKCPVGKHGKFCGKQGYLIEEPPRKKNITIHSRFRNKEYKPYTSTRKRGSYWRVHHYISDNQGKRKSRFCYLGNFEGALEKLERINEILETYATSSKGSDPVYDNDFFVWKISELEDIKEMIKQAKKLDEFKEKPNTYAEIIFKTIADAQYYLIRVDKIFRKYA